MVILCRHLVPTRSTHDFSSNLPDICGENRLMSTIVTPCAAFQAASGQAFSAESISGIGHFDLDDFKRP